MIMSYAIQDILLYLKNIVMLIEYLMLKTQNPIVGMCLHWEEQQSHGILKTNDYCQIHNGI